MTAAPLGMRELTDADLPAVVALQQRYDEHWFGRAEHDADEVREALGHAAPGATRGVFVRHRLVGAGWWTGTDASLLAEPSADAPAVADVLLPWFAEVGAQVDVLGRDEALTAAVERAGWTHHHSAFELLRDLADGWRPAAPSWPDGITRTELRRDDVEQVHRLIYVDAGWTEVPGHPDRPYEQWRQIFVTEAEVPSQQVLAWRDDRLVGVAMGRIFSDGAGWIAQLAVARAERGRGLGRALLLEALRRRIDAGATLVGLQVSATNRAAIGLYLDAGLRIDREWLTYAPPTA